MEKIEYFDDRFYKVQNGKETVYLPSSTTILNIVAKPWLARWRGDVGNETADYKSHKAALKGSLIHDACHRLWNGETLSVEHFQQDEWVQIMRFQVWYDFLKPVLAQPPELTVYSLSLGYAGTLDFAVRIKKGVYNTGYAEKVKLEEGIYIGDLKTGTQGEDKNYFRQLASYDHAFESIFGEKPVGAFILHTQASTKQGWKMIIRNREQLDEDFLSFQHAMYLWISENPKFEPKTMEMPLEISLY